MITKLEPYFKYQKPSDAISVLWQEQVRVPISPKEKAVLNELLELIKQFNHNSSFPLQWDKFPIEYRKDFQTGKKHVSSILLRHKNLPHLPASIDHLSNLEYLDLSDNKLACLPASFEHLSQLKSVCLDRNEFPFVPPSVVTLAGNQLHFFFDMGKNPIRSLWGYSPLAAAELAYLAVKCHDSYDLTVKGQKLVEICGRHYLALKTADLYGIALYRAHPSYLEPLLNYYAKSPWDLAYQYLTARNSLTEDELIRLHHEVDSEIAHMLATYLSTSDPLLDGIRTRLDIQMTEDFLLKI